MFKKIASIVIAAAMMISTAAFSISAAEDSAAVSADNSSEVGAEASDEVGAGNIIKFDVKKSGWNLDTTKKVFCHIWRADGKQTSEGKDWPGWQAKVELCKFDKKTGIAEYDLSKADPGISKSDGKVYCVIFSANTGMQTYNTIMSGACIGDTAYCTGEEIENPEDSEKKAAVAAWENNKDCGPEKKITSTGNIVGTAFPEGESNETLVANYLMSYFDDPAKTDLTETILKTLKVDAADVMAVVKDRASDDQKKVDAIEKILSKFTTKDLSKVEANKGSSNNGGTTTNSVKSGQETTIFFVFGGLMLAAAGVAFLARKKREE